MCDRLPSRQAVGPGDSRYVLQASFMPRPDAAPARTGLAGGSSSCRSPRALPAERPGSLGSPPPAGLPAQRQKHAGIGDRLRAIGRDGVFTMAETTVHDADPGVHDADLAVVARPSPTQLAPSTASTRSPHATPTPPHSAIPRPRRPHDWATQQPRPCKPPQTRALHPTSRLLRQAHLVASARSSKNSRRLLALVVNTS